MGPSWFSLWDLKVGLRVDRFPSKDFIVGLIVNTLPSWDLLVELTLHRFSSWDLIGELGVDMVIMGLLKMGLSG